MIAVALLGGAAAAEERTGFVPLFDGRTLDGWAPEATDRFSVRDGVIHTGGSTGWLEVLPGVVAVVGGLLLVRSRNRATAMLGGWLSVVAGAWFVVG